MRQNEIKHGRAISSTAENIWGWASAAGKLRASRRIRLFIEKGSIEKGKKILEIGCGTGIFTAGVAKTLADVTACDISAELLDMLNPQIALQKNFPPFKKIMGDSPDETAFFRWRLPDIFRKYGFCSVKVEQDDFLHPAIPDFMTGAMEKLAALAEKVPVIREISGSLFIYAEKNR